MTLRFRETPDEIIVFIAEANSSDDLQILEVHGLSDFCNRAASTARRTIVDLGSIRFMTSAMIGDLVLFSEAAKQHSLEIRFVNLSPNLHEVFKITRLHEEFRLDDDSPDFLGAVVPNPKPPDTLDRGADASRDEK